MNNNDILRASIADHLRAQKADKTIEGLTSIRGCMDMLGRQIGNKLVNIRVEYIVRNGQIIARQYVEGQNSL